MLLHLRHSGFAWSLALVMASTRIQSVCADNVKSPAPSFLREWGQKGDGPGEFNIPIGIAISKNDEILIGDHRNARVQKFDADGKHLATFAVTPYPGGMAFDGEGNLYITNFGFSKQDEKRGDEKVSVYSPVGKLLRSWGKTGTEQGEFDCPGGLAIGKEGRVYVADQTNRRIQVFDREGRFLIQWGKYGVGPGEFGGNTNPKSRVGGPQFVAIDKEGSVYTTEASMGRVQKFTPEGKFLAAWGDNEDKPGSFGGLFGAFKANLKGPIGICFDPKERLWISAVSGRVQRFSKDGKYQVGIGEKQGTNPGEFFAPHGVAIDSKGHLYVVDSYNNRVQKFAMGD